MIAKVMELIRPNYLMASISKKREVKFTITIEKIIELFIFLCAFISVISVMLITIYIFFEGVPAIFEIGVFNFLFGTEWNPVENTFGIFPMILASIFGTLGATLIGGFIGVLTAVFMAEIAPAKIVRFMRPAVQLLAGIPSVVYGFFGLIVLVPIIDGYLGGGGNSLLAVIIVLSIMILPIIINISEVAIKSVPKEYKEGSLALGASKIQTIYKVILPAAKSGVLAAIVLGVGRAIGETMAVILVAGNSPIMPDGLSGRVRTMTGNIAIEMGYAFGLHQEALFATGVVLFIFIILINKGIHYILNRSLQQS